MRTLNPRVPYAVLAVVLTFTALTITLPSARSGHTASASPDQSASLAAWDEIATVLMNPRCLNCHQLNSPLQGDSRRAHIPRVVRGTDNHGVGAMRCGNCHNDMGNNPTSARRADCIGSSRLRSLPFDLTSLA